MSTQVAPIRQNQAVQPAEARMPEIRAGFFDLQAFELIQRVSKAFASSDLVPRQFQGNLANCMIAMDMAQRIGANPLMVMQNLYVVHGTPSWSSKFLVATINACGRFSALRYEWRGEPGSNEYGCRAWALEKATGERLDGIWVTWKMVKAEGWDSKNGSKWNTMPDQMFLYRAAAFWQRAYAPELGMGLITQEEAQDVIDVTPMEQIQRATVVHVPTPEPRRDVDMATGEIDPPQQQVQTRRHLCQFIARIQSCTDMAVFQLLNDEAQDLPDGPARDQVMAALLKRDEELANAAHPPVQAQPAPAARRTRAAGASME